MYAKQRLYLTADRSKLVAEGDKRAAFLYCTLGDEIPQSAADKFGLVDGALQGSEKAKPAGGNKEKKPGGGKDKKPGGDKGDKPDDVTRIKGIGAASAKALAAVGIDGFAALAAVDPSKPPEVEGLGPNVAWEAWVAEAKALTGAPAAA